MMCATGLRQRLLSVLLASMASLATLPTAAMAQPASETLDSSASVTGTFVLPQRSPWAGEVFDLGIRWDIEWQRFNFLDCGPQWSPASLVAGAWSAPVTTA